MSEDPQTETTLNIPSILVFTILASLLVRYLFFSSPASNAASGASGTARRIPLDKIDTVATMFPQLNRRDIEWDLVRNGGSVQATTERVLRSGRLDNPPPNFVAQDSPVAASVLAGVSSASTSTLQTQKHSDLITRYDLSSKINPVAGPAQDSEGDSAVSREKQAGPAAGNATQNKAWSANKVERQALLKKRRDDMVLTARRKLLEKDQGGAPEERGPS